MGRTTTIAGTTTDGTEEPLSINLVRFYVNSIYCLKLFQQRKNTINVAD